VDECKPLRGGERAAAVAEVAALARVLAALAPSSPDSPPTDWVEQVAFGLQQQLGQSERAVVLGLAPADVDSGVHTSIGYALGL
jgi:hypothetical protein